MIYGGMRIALAPAAVCVNFVIVYKLELKRCSNENRLNKAAEFPFSSQLTITQQYLSG